MSDEKQRGVGRVLLGSQREGPGEQRRAGEAASMATAEQKHRDTHECPTVFAGTGSQIQGMKQSIAIS